MTDGCLAKRYPFAFRGGYLYTQKAFAHCGAPRGAFGKGAIEPGTNREYQDIGPTRENLRVPGIDAKYAPKAAKHKIERDGEQQRS